MSEIILDEGEVICDKCGGTGINQKLDGKYRKYYKPEYNFNPSCPKCRGAKKLTWIEDLLGRSNTFYTRPSVSYESYKSDVGVWIDISNGVDGTHFPIGTLQHPVNNLNDALEICKIRGFEYVIKS